MVIEYIWEAHKIDRHDMNEKREYSEILIWIIDLFHDVCLFICMFSGDNGVKGWMLTWLPNG